MVVADASAVLDLLLRTPAAGFAEAELLTDSAEVHAPAILDLEVAGVLRRGQLAGRLSAPRAELALEVYEDQRIVLHQPRVLLRRAWMLRENLTMSDGLYAALAEAIGATLVTTDLRMAAVVQQHTEVEVIAPR